MCINLQTKFEVRTFINSKYMIGGEITKTGHVALTTPIRVMYVIRILALDIFHLHTKFGHSRFSCSGDMIAGVKIENGSCHPDHALFDVVCYPKARIVYLCAKFDDTSLAVHEISLGAAKFKMGHVTLTTHL